MVLHRVRVSFGPCDAAACVLNPRGGVSRVGVASLGFLVGLVSLVDDLVDLVDNPMVLHWVMPGLYLTLPDRGAFSGLWGWGQILARLWCLGFSNEGWCGEREHADEYEPERDLVRWGHV